MAEFWKVVLYKRPSPEAHKLEGRFAEGIWVGKTTRADDHLIVVGGDALRSRTLKRVPDGQRWNSKLALEISALPWKMKATVVKPVRPHIPRKYITWAYVQKYGSTPGCKACAVDGACPQ